MSYSVSIDFEGLSSIMDATTTSQGQVGIAIFDTRDLTPSLSSSSSVGSMITTHNFVTGSSHYCASATKRFLFGETITISQQEMFQKLESVIPLTRNIILVGHDIWNDLKVLRYLKFDTRTSILGILDTQQIAREVPSTAASSGRLRNILTELRCPFDELHSAGNDANFTLRALLLLAVQCYASETLCQEDQRTLELIREVAQYPIPNRRDLKEARALKKKMKRLEKSRKHQAKSWDTETKESIRAERAARRITREDGDLQLL
ncbi:Polynucleotidyl transferase [Exophiala viscosa]|uniref:Polynucleotidyl transferase n=1 Tax=Exophiala viscosa TaxID=2486360 RepID=A0AAN6ICM2_9EURO|nr:Polynucleotidyl transferase [Exophiala viscosa]KAI1626007.1 Polynucleotidyl transferase [Exophiala viscosa]